MLLNISPRRWTQQHQTISIENFNLDLHRTAKSTHHPHKIDDQNRECKIGGSAYFAFLFRDFLKAHDETTTAIKRRKVSCTSSGNCRIFDLSFHGRCISRSLQDSAEVVISRLLAGKCRSLAVVVSAVFASRRWPFASQRWPGGEVVISRSLPLWGVGRLNWDTRKVVVSWLL